MQREVIEKVLKYIDENINEKIRLNNLAFLAGYSPFYFSVMFSEFMGISVSEYIRIRKLQYAIKNLLKGEKVIDVSLKYGFESHEVFTRAFVKAFGLPPKTVKKLREYEVPKYIVSDTIQRKRGHEMKTSEDLLDDMHQIIFLFLEEAFCEAEAGFCTKIDICLLSDNQVQISDNGRGLPLSDNMDVNEEIFRKTLSGVPLTRLDYENMKEIKNQGLQTAGALCERMDVSVYKNGNVYMQDYVRGIARNNLRCQKMCHKQGMNIQFIPDKEIFGKRRYSKECIDAWVRERLKGVEGVEVKIEDQRIE